MTTNPDRPKRLVLLGHPVSHSLSPIFQTAALRSAGLDVTYDALEVLPDALRRVLADLARGNVAGNVTIPHKETVFELCTRRTEIADRVGAVNTFWHERGKLVGDNTDVAGARAAIASVLDASATVAGFARSSRSALRVAVLGAGGAAAAVLVALEEFAPLTVAVWSRSSARAHSLASRLNVAITVADDASDAVADANLVINCTPLGLTGTEVPVNVEALQPAARILDLIARSGETEWVRLCKMHGHVCEDGVRMLIEQGAESFERWFHIAPDRASMRRSLKLRSGAG
ncbi:MAG: shikimate dehydrogenase, partial [Gemmatimonadota bacterium]|nr:shikimate dehydrogenase [Gemmatimonadota bacterium]